MFSALEMLLIVTFLVISHMAIDKDISIFMAPMLAQKLLEHIAFGAAKVSSDIRQQFTI